MSILLYYIFYQNKKASIWDEIIIVCAAHLANLN